MKKDNFADESSAIVCEAAAWIAQLESGELRATDRDALREWLRRSPRHYAELQRLAQLSQEMNILTEMAAPLRESAEHYQPPMRRHPARSGLQRSLAVVFVGLVALICGVLWMQFARSPLPQVLIVTTAIGDYRQLELDDGTVIHLNTATQIEVSERRVRLLAGEAYFDIAPDRLRPFVVYAGTSRIRVFGTAFLVSFIAEELQLTVAEGKVELRQTALTNNPVSTGETSVNDDSRTERPGEPLLMEAGQSIHISPQQLSSPVLPVSARELQRQLSWQQGLLDFSNAPLSSVVKELNRYSTLQIELADASLEELRFGGIFRTGETEGLLDALQSAYGIHVEYVNDSRVRLSLLDTQ